MMKKVLVSLVLASCVFANLSLAQEATSDTAMEQADTAAKADTGVADTTAQAADTTDADTTATASKGPDAPSGTGSGGEQSGHQVIKEKFIEGGGFMFPVLVSLIIGLAVCIERIITLNMKDVNSTKILNDVEGYLSQGDVEGAKDYVRDTRGPLASIFFQALDRRTEGTEMVEKSVVSYGSVQMGLLEKGLTWISLFIAIAPMLGLMGTVSGMIQAFDRIEAAGDGSPSLVAAGIKTALLTTVSGLIVGVILQVFYNYLVSKVDSLVNDMEDSSISLVDMMIKHNVITNKNS